MRHGAIVEMGETEKVFGNPQHDYTKMLLSAVPELHKKWQHTPLGPVAVSGNGQVAATETIESSPNGRGVTALARASLADETTHKQRVVKRDRRVLSGLLGGSRVASGGSAIAFSLEPPVLHEFEPGHLVAETE